MRMAPSNKLPNEFVKLALIFAILGISRSVNRVERGHKVGGALSTEEVRENPQSA
jgi:hypothetical protein